MKNAVLFILLVVIVGLTTLEFQNKVLQKPVKQKPAATLSRSVNVTVPIQTINETSTERSVEGEFLCLPHNVQKNKTTATETKDCIFGLKLIEGTFIALDIDETDAEEKLIPGAKIHVNGNYVPREQLIDEFNYYEKNAISGVIRATSVLQL